MRLELLVGLAPTERPVAGYVSALMWRGQRVKSIAQQAGVILLAGAVAFVLADTMDRRLDIVVVGAGMVGVSTAIWLLRDGHRVTLIDRGKPGQAASFGNAGLLAQWAFVPVTTPGLMRHAPGYVLNPNSPLFLRWSYLPRLLPWLWRYMAQANPRDAERAVQGLIPLVMDSLDQHRALAEGSSAAQRIQPSDFAYAYPDRAAFQGDSYAWDTRRAAGYVPELIEGAAVQEAEPALAPNIRLLAVLRDHGHILFPGDYVTELARDFAAAGGQVVQAKVRDFTLEGGQITAVQTDVGTFPCNRAVITAGIWSKELAARIGMRVPLEAERGYHITYDTPAQMPRQPLMITQGKFGATPMGSALRCAGMVELGGTSAGPSKAPLRLLRRVSQQAFPGLAGARGSEWMGFRPSTPDSLPLIGQIGQSGVFAGFGHQHVGLTAGPKTGRLIADLIARRRPNMDLSPYDPMRYAG